MARRLIFKLLEQSTKFGRILHFSLILFLGLIFRLAGNKASLKQIESSGVSDEWIAKFYNGNQFYFVGWKRCSRYIKGVDFAGLRLVRQYKLDSCSEKLSTFIDIGANVGEVSLYFADRNVSVYSFEPDPNCFRALKKNLENRSNVILFNIALSNEDGFKKFYLKSDSADSSLHFVHGSEASQSQVRKLDSFELDIQRDTCLKMDAEGHEPEVILGGVSTFSKIDIVSIDAGYEREKKATYRECIELLEKEFDCKHYENNIVLAMRRIE